MVDNAARSVGPSRGRADADVSDAVARRTKRVERERACTNNVMRLTKSNLVD